MPQQRLFVSDSFAVLQDALVTAVQALKNTDPLVPLTVLVPGDLLALQLRRAVARVGRGHVGLRVFPLLDFAREAAEAVLVQEGQQSLRPLAALRIMKKLLREAEPDNYFAPLATYSRFPQTLLATITDLKQAEVQPQQLRAFVESTEQGEVSRHKLDSLSILYDRYTRFLQKRRFYDDDDLLERAAVVLATAPKTSPLFLYGFYDFTPLQRRLIAAAVKERDVLAFFPWRAGSACEYATPTLPWLTSLGLQYTRLTPPERHENALVHIQTRLFEERLSPFSTPPAKSDKSVILISAPGESREAREIARVILDLVREHGFRFHEIGVLLRDSATYGTLLTETFTGLGIPCFLYGGLPLMRTQAGQSLSLLCQVLAENYVRSRVFEFLSVTDSPFTSLLGDLARYARPARWEAFSLEAGIVRGTAEWRERLLRLEASYGQNEESDGEDQEVVRAFCRFMRGFLAASESLPQVNTWQGWAEQTLRLFRTYVSPTAHSTDVEEALMRLGQLDLLGESISLEEWARTITSTLATATTEIGAFEKEGVCLGDLLAMCGVQFRAVIVPGLIEGGFPKTVRQDPLLLDAERQYVAEVLGCDLPQRRRLSEEERLLFVLATQSATERLVFTYPRLDQGNGHVQAPSFYLLDVIEALSGKSASLADLEERCVRVPLTPLYAGPPSRAIDNLEFHLATVELARVTRDLAPLGYLPMVAPFFSYALSAAHQRWETPELTAFDGMIADDQTRTSLLNHLFPHGLTLSASALEMYARCPFQYFLNVVLGVTSREAPEQVLTLQPRDRGALLHGILYDFFIRLRQTEKLPVTTQEWTALESLLRQVAEEHFHTFARTHATGFPLLWELEQERMAEQLALLLDREYNTASDFLPVAFEARFGGDVTEEQKQFFPPESLRFALGNGEEIRLHGRIDRIDLSMDARRARLLDYKTGKLIRGRFAGGMALQLPLYLFAARALRPDLEWVSADYVYVNQTGGRAVPSFTAEMWPESEETLRHMITALVEGIRSGCFVASPDSCSPCSFSLICGSQVNIRAARKQDDPRLDWLRRVRAVV